MRNQAWKKCPQCGMVVPADNIQMVEISNDKSFAAFLGKKKFDLMCNHCINDHNSQYVKGESE